MRVMPVKEALHKRRMVLSLEKPSMYQTGSGFGVVERKRIGKSHSKVYQ